MKKYNDKELEILETKIKKITSSNDVLAYMDENLQLSAEVYFDDKDYVIYRYSENDVKKVCYSSMEMHPNIDGFSGIDYEIFCTMKDDYDRVIGCCKDMSSFEVDS